MHECHTWERLVPLGAKQVTAPLKHQQSIPMIKTNTNSPICLQQKLTHVTVCSHMLLSHLMICHSKKCHRPRTSSCHKEQRRHIQRLVLLVKDMAPCDTSMKTHQTCARSSLPIPFIISSACRGAACSNEHLQK